MNFQAVMAAPGQYIQLQARITEIRHFSGDYGPYALGKAQDQQGAVAEVFFTVKKESQFPTGLCVGHTCNWAGRYDANTQKMKLYFGTMAQKDVSPQAPQQAPPVADEPYHVPVQQPQSSPPPPQAPMAPQGGRDAKEVSIERQACWKGLCELAARRADLVPDKVAFFDMLYHGHKWIETGIVDPTAISSPMPKAPANWDGEPAKPPVSDSDIPF